MQKASMMKLARIAQGMTQADLAKKVGKHQVTISEFERGCRVATVRNRKKIAQALGVSVDSLFPVPVEESREIGRAIKQTGRSKFGLYIKESV